MHVVMLPSWYPENFDDLNGIFFREQAEALAGAGMRVGVIAVEGVSVNHPTARSRSTMATVTTSQERGVAVMRAKALRPLPLAHRINAASLVRRWRTLFDDYVRAHGMPDVIHAHTMRPAGFAAQAISAATGVPYVVTEHRPETAVADSQIATLRKLLSACQRDASALIAVSPGFADALAEAYGVQKWRSLPNLLPPQFEGAGVVGGGEQFVFGHVSNLDPVKRVDLLIDAFHQAFLNEPSVCLRIAGDSVQRAALELRAQRLGATNIEFVGNVSREQIVSEFLHYDVFVMPSRMESFGVVFWEAMACGLPIIATDTAGGMLAVTDESGMLVPRDDLGALARSLTEMRLKCPSYDRQEIRNRALNFCGQDAFVRGYREVYEQAVTAKRSNVS